MVFNLDPSISNDDLRRVFGPYGEIKEVRDSIGQIICFPFYSIYSFSLVCFLKELVYVKYIWHPTFSQIRETPYKKHHKFIEYYDVRAAEAALRSLHKRDIAGKRIKLEPSRPGGARRKWVIHFNFFLIKKEKLELSKLMLVLCFWITSFATILLLQ